MSSCGEPFLLASGAPATATPATRYATGSSPFASRSLVQAYEAGQEVREAAADHATTHLMRSPAPPGRADRPAPAFGYDGRSVITLTTEPTSESVRSPSHGGAGVPAPETGSATRARTAGLVDFEGLRGDTAGPQALCFASAAETGIDTSASVVRDSRLVRVAAM